MQYKTRLRSRAIKHGIILIGAGICGDENTIGDYIEVHGNPDDFHIEHFGEDYEGRIVYHIREAGCGFGFCAELRVLLEHLIFANQYGMLPCVQYGRDYLYYEEELSERYTSAWEYFFCPIGFDIDVSKARNVLESKPGYAKAFEITYKSDGSHYSTPAMNRLAETYRSYVRLRPEIYDRIQNEFSGIRNGYQNLLGIHFRGTDYKCGYDGHPHIQDLNEIIKKAKTLLDKGYDGIFLATDDIEAVNQLRNTFGKQLVLYDDNLRSDSRKNVAFLDNSRPMHHYTLGYEVLRDVYSLSFCEGLIGGLSQVTLISRLVRRSTGEAYRDEVITDNGINNNLHIFHGRADLQMVQGR